MVDDRKGTSRASVDLRAWLAREGISQAELARRIGLAHRTVAHRWLTGERRPSLEMAAALERMTGGLVRASDWVEHFRAVEFSRKTDLPPL